MQLHTYHSPDDGQPDGGESDEGGKVKASDILNRYGKNEEAALRLAELYADAQNTLYRLRTQKRTLTDERDTLRKQLPADGAVVVSAADAALLDSYQALGAPDAVKAMLDAAQTANAKLASLEREARTRAAADAVGYKPGVLATLAGELELATKAGKDGPQAFVVADGTETPLEDYAAAHWADFLPALRPSSAPAAPPIAPDIDAGGRGGNPKEVTQEQRENHTRRFARSF